MSLMDVEKVCVQREPIESLPQRLAQAAIAGGLVSAGTVEGLLGEGYELSRGYYEDLGVVVVDSPTGPPNANPNSDEARRVPREPIESLPQRLAQAAIAAGLVSAATLEGLQGDGYSLEVGYYMDLGLKLY